MSDDPDRPDGETDPDDPFEAIPDAGEGEDPFERLDGDADPGRRTPAAAEDLFEEVDVGGPESPATWDELVSDDGLADGAPPSAEGEGEGEGPTGVGETVVSKRRYCERCEHFSTPPETACTHEGTEILSLVDVAHFRVRGCPVVARRRSAYGADLLESED